MRKISELVGRSVFKKMAPGREMNAILAVVFHRSAATLYLLYFAWGVAQTIQGAPSLVLNNGQTWTTIFAILVMITTAPSCFGATFWPNFARLELFAGSSVVTLLFAYIAILGYNTFFLHNSTVGGWILSITVIVIPAARTAVVFLFLSNQAELDPHGTGPITTQGA